MGPHNEPRRVARAGRRFPALGAVAALLAVALLLASPPPARAGPLPQLPPSLAITSFVDDPASIVISASTWFNVTVTGGAPPYTFGYSGLPPGCLSQNVSSLLCTPGEVQTFHVTVAIHDSVGSRVNSTVVLSVVSGFNGPPVIDSVTITPDPVAVGQVAQILVNAVSVSNSTLAYFYFDLPPGCTSFNATPLECLPSAPGTYSIGIQVTDAFGLPVQQHVPFHVTGSANGPSGHAGTALPSYVIIVVPALVLGVVVVVAAILMLRRPRRPAAAGPQP